MRNKHFYSLERIDLKMCEVSKDVIRSIINDESLENAIKHCIDYKDIMDDELRKWWKTAEKALKKIEKIIKDYEQEEYTDNHFLEIM